MNRKTISTIFRILNGHQKQELIRLIFFMILGMMLEALGVSVIIPVIALLSNSSVSQNYPYLVPVLNLVGNPSHERLCLYAAFSLIGIYALKVVLQTFVIRREAAFSFGLQESLAEKLFSLYMHQPYHFHLNINSTELVKNVTGEVNILVFKVVSPLIKIVAELVLLLFISLLLFVVEPVGAISVMILLGFSGWIFQRMTKKMVSEWGRERQHHEAKIVFHLHQGLGGIKDAILLGREKNFVRNFADHNTGRVLVGQKENVLNQIPRLWIELFAVIGMALLICLIIFQGKDVSTIVPTLGVFAAGAFRLMPSVSRLLTCFQSVRFGIPAVKSMAKEFELEPSILAGEESFKLISSEINVNNVEFMYPNTDKNVLNGITMKIPFGEAVGIVGESGSGKSTLIDCILGLLIPKSGTITVDGSEIHQNLRSWQKQIGYVSQTIYLADDTLRKNVAYGLPDHVIDDEAVKKALKLAQLDKFIDGLPDGMETTVGERGVRLSGGQRQRIGIARALYHDPPVLILDEATSSLDIATEQEVMKGVYELVKGKTLIIIAHRLSTVARCHNIYHLASGRVVNNGRPEEVLQRIEADLKVKSLNKTGGGTLVY